MARTLIQIKQQIESLEKEAERVKDGEIADVIARIKKAIDFYELTPKDLFDTSAKKMGRPKKVVSGAAKKQPKNKATAKYQDPASGKTWTGHGKRPGWFLQAIEGGKTAENLAV